jgi:hypothetical protein
MRRFFVVVALAACAPRTAPGPAWPKGNAVADDGGESLAPRVSHPATTSIERAEDEVKPAATPVATPVIAPSVQLSGATAPAAPAAAPPEEPITAEDIVIEVDE